MYCFETNKTYTGFRLLLFFLFLSLSLLGLAFMFYSTALNPEFVISELGKFDVYSLTREWLVKQISQFEVNDDYQLIVDKVLNETFTDLEPWMKREVNATVYTGYDYFLGRSQRLSLAISTERGSTV